MYLLTLGSRGQGTVTILHVPSVAGQEEGEGGLLAWAERTGRRRAAQPDGGGLRFVFYRRVSTEDYQDR